MSTTVRQLFVPDKLLKNDNNNYTLKPNWFIHLYSFLQWQREAVEVLIQNLVHFNKQLTDGDTVGLTHYFDGTDHEEKGIASDMILNILAAEEFFYKFDVLTLLHLYSNELMEYLVLFYCCFDSRLWISIFYPFIEAGVGTLNCNMIFAQSNVQFKDKLIKSIYDEALQMKLDYNSKETILQEMKAVSIFKHLLYDVYNYNEQNCALDTDAPDIRFDPFDLAVKIGVKLNETIDNIKTQMTIHEITGRDVNNATKTETYTDKIIIKVVVRAILNNTWSMTKHQ